MSNRKMNIGTNNVIDARERFAGPAESEQLSIEIDDTPTDRVLDVMQAMLDRSYYYGGAVDVEYGASLLQGKDKNA